MSIAAEAGPSVEKKEKKVRMIDGREETKEERKARKAAKKEVGPLLLPAMSDTDEFAGKECSDSQ